MNKTARYKVTKQVRFGRAHRARRVKLPDEAPPTPATRGRVPRIARLMALAIRFQKLIDDGVIENQAEIARLSHVSRARVTQIMNLLHLAPDIQEAILFLPPTKSGRDPIREIHVRPIVAAANWDEQRKLWKQVERRCHSGSQPGARVSIPADARKVANTPSFSHSMR